MPRYAQPLSIITVAFTTDEEAGAVYGVIRKLKRDTYVAFHTMYDDHALINVKPIDVDTVIDTFVELAHSKKMPGIHVQED